MIETSQVNSHFFIHLFPFLFDSSSKDFKDWKLQLKKRVKELKKRGKMLKKRGKILQLYPILLLFLIIFRHYKNKTDYGNLLKKLVEEPMKLEKMSKQLEKMSKQLEKMPKQLENPFNIQK